MLNLEFLYFDFGTLAVELITPSSSSIEDYSFNLELHYSKFNFPVSVLLFPYFPNFKHLLSISK